MENLGRQRGRSRDGQDREGTVSGGWGETIQGQNQKG